MIYPKIPLAQSIIQICLAKGVDHIVISPGSRNAPLIVGFANDSKFKCYSIADERSAAFFALGLAQQIRMPVALVCTSGSALLNYYPAFAEAFYSQIPLVVISADRPKHKIDIGDGQTIRQENVFINHSLFNANLEEGASQINDTKINEAINNAINKKGPVHINVPFEEPLYETVSELSVAITCLENTKLDYVIDSETIASTESIWNNSNKILVLIGENKPNSLDQAWIDCIALNPSVVVLTETTSNIHHETFIANIDALITPFTNKDFLKFQPDLLITFGGMIVSKRIKSLIRKFPPKNHWHIDELRAYDTFGALTKHFRTTPNHFFGELLPHTIASKSDYKNVFQEINISRKVKHNKYLSLIPFCDLKVFEIVLSQLPNAIQLQVSNSSAIRYAQIFDVNQSIEVFCNRGTSGIDGSTSTAIGAAVGSKKATVFITGDVGFFYDNNALWNNYIPKNFKIILINNGGGGIFRILPGHEETVVFNTFFETSHCLTAEHLAKMHQFDYISASDENTLNEGLLKLFNDNENPKILEIFTPTRENQKLLLDYFSALA